jgi:hypothetical protein
MTTTGWVFLIVCWGVVAWWTGWGMYHVLTSRAHWTRPEEDIAELHHGEYGERVPKEDGEAASAPPSAPR